MADIVAALCSLPDAERLMATDVLIRYSGRWTPVVGARENPLAQMFKKRDTPQDGAAWSESIVAGWERYGVANPDQADLPAFVRTSLAAFHFPENGWPISFDDGDEYGTTCALLAAGQAAELEPTLSPVQMAKAVAGWFGAREDKTESSIMGRASALFSRGDKDEDPTRRAHSRFIAKDERSRGECLTFLVWLAADAMTTAALGGGTVDWPSSHLEPGRHDIATTPEMQQLAMAADEAQKKVTQAQQIAARKLRSWNDAESTASGYRGVIANGPQKLTDLESERVAAIAAVAPKEAMVQAAREAHGPRQAAAQAARNALAQFESAYDASVAAAADDDVRARLTQEKHAASSPLQQSLYAAEQAEAETAERLRSAEADASAQRDSVRKLESSITSWKKDVERAHVALPHARDAASQAGAEYRTAEESLESGRRETSAIVEQLRVMRVAQLQEFDVRASEFASWWHAALAQNLGMEVRFAPGLAEAVFQLSREGIRVIEELAREIASSRHPGAIATGVDTQGKRSLGCIAVAAERSPRAVLSEMSTGTDDYLDVLGRCRAVPTINSVQATYLITYDPDARGGNGEREVGILSIACTKSQPLKSTGSPFWKLG